MVNLHLTGEFWLTKKIKKSNIEKEIIQERIWNIRIISFFYTLWNSIGCSSAPPGACVTGYSGVYLMEQHRLFLRPARGMCYGILWSIPYEQHKLFPARQGMYCGVPCGYTLP